ncbi:hypothetical protein E2320_008135, partial [Naja naja]
HLQILAPFLPSTRIEGLPVLSSERVPVGEDIPRFSQSEQAQPFHPPRGASVFRAGAADGLRFLVLPFLPGASRSETSPDS